MSQTGTPSAGALLVFDDGAMRRATAAAFADAVRPVATQTEAQAGSDNAKTMTALRVKQSIASQVGVTLQGYGAPLPVVDQNITSAGPVSVSNNASIVRVNQTINAAITLNIPGSASKQGPVLIVDWKGNSGTYPITLQLSGSDTFQGGLTSWTINGDGGSVLLRPIPGVGYAL